MRATAALIALAAYTAIGVDAAQQQVPLGAPPPSPESKKRELKGRFLHITDFHPDPFYKAGATFESGCHRPPKKAKHKSYLENPLQPDVAGRWGTALSDCDSPMSLVDLTFDWMKKEWLDEIDFIIWTGDSARHDIDRVMPRSGKEIFDLNKMMAKRMLDLFGKEFPIVPTLGNNDIYPHNILDAGPNRVTQEFLTIWKPWIPEDDRHVFERGAYFAREVIPNQLVVISLNTIYFYASNSAVDGCKSGSQEAGALHMDWLEVQLELYRDRGLQVILIGHVPPHLGVYYDDCYLRYGDLGLRFQDTIIGHFFGHQNVDHFFFHDVDELEAIDFSSRATASNSSRFLDVPTDQQLVGKTVEDFTFLGPELRHGEHILESGRVKVMGKKGDMIKDLLKNSFQSLAKPGNVKMEDYSVMNVAPSVIPTYIPSARIVAYNITGVNPDGDFNSIAYKPHSVEEDLEASKKKKKKKPHKDECDKAKNRDKPHCYFQRKPRYESPESPSRSNKPLSLLGWTQFFLPDIDENTAERPEWKIEYTSFKPKSLLPPSLTDGLDGPAWTQPPPVPYHLLPGYDSSIVAPLTPAELATLESGDDSSFDAETKDEDSRKRASFLNAVQSITPWKMSDLTIPSYVRLGRQLLDDKKLWKKFIKFMFVSSGGD